MYIHLDSDTKTVFPLSRLLRSKDNIFDILDSWMYDAHERYSWDYTTTDTHITYTLPIPGFKKSDLDVEISGRHLIVRTADDSTSTFGKFRTEVAIHRDADLAKYEAKVEDGIFSIAFEKRQDVLPVKQKVKLLE